MYTIAEGKFPKKPGYGNILEVCRKDFRNFKRDNENKVYKLFNENNLRFTEIRIDPLSINNHKDNMESIREFIKEGKENIAFSLFFRTFPTCLPHRSRL